MPIVFLEYNESKPKSPERCVSPDSGDDDVEEDEEEEEEEEEVKPTVIVIARSHPGDANTSFVAQGVWKWEIIFYSF